MTSARSTHYQRLSAILASCSDTDLASLIDTDRAANTGVGGGSAVVDVDGMPVFVKRIPLTDRELANPGSTSNLFDLPVFCQYGIASPGFNAWRELVANMIVTDAVLSGETQSFSLLYHWRVLPGRSPVTPEHADIDAAVATLGGSSAVRIRLEALAAASFSLVLFCEYIAHPVSDWLHEDPADKAAMVERQFAQIVTFLRGRELLHMDGHLGNMRTDGDRIYLNDFGLATSPGFDLSVAESEFAERHATHDAGYAAMQLVNWLVTDVCGVAVPAHGRPLARNEYVLQCAAGFVPDDVPPIVAAILTRHASAAARMNAFYWKLFGGEINAEFLDV